MRLEIITLAVLMLGVGAYATTAPGTIISTCATASYTDAAGQTMPEQDSNQARVLVTSSSADRTVMLNISALYAGPSTIGRTIKVLGTVATDPNGSYLYNGETIDNGSGSQIQAICRISTLFLTQRPPAGRFMAVTGISQIDTDGTPVVIPSGDAQVQDLTP
jgi:hypothetical protein